MTNDEARIVLDKLVKRTAMSATITITEREAIVHARNGLDAVEKLSERVAKLDLRVDEADEMCERLLTIVMEYAKAHRS